MDRLVLIFLLTLGAILVGLGVRTRGTRYALWLAAAGVVVIVATVVLRLILGS